MNLYLDLFSVGVPGEATPASPSLGSVVKISQPGLAKPAPPPRVRTPTTGATAGTTRVIDKPAPPPRVRSPATPSNDAPKPKPRPQSMAATGNRFYGVWYITVLAVIS